MARKGDATCAGTPRLVGCENCSTSRQVSINTSRSTEYQTAAGMARDGKSHIPCGQVTKDDNGQNRVEAWDESGDPAKMNWDE